MPINSKKVKTLYDALVADGADVGTEDEFNNWFFARGEQGYKNRKTVFDAFKADGADVGDNYEEFASLIGLYGKPATQQPRVQQPKQASATPIDFAPLDTRQANQRMIGRGPVPFEQPQPAGEEKIFDEGVQKRIGQRMDEIQYEQETGKHLRQPVFNPTFEAPTIAKDEYGNIRRDENGNIMTGFSTDEDIVGTHNQIKKEQEEWDKLSDAEKFAKHKQNILDSGNVDAMLEEAYKERDRIESMLAGSINDPSEQGFFDKIGQAGLGSPSTFDYRNASDYMLSNPMARDLMAAARKNREYIKMLEDVRDNQTNEFWHSFATDISNGYNFSLGGSANIDDAAALRRAQQYAESINKKRQEGKSLTREEQVAEAVLNNAMWDREVQEKYGDEYGAWARAGKMGAKSADFMLDFLMMGGAPEATARAVMNTIVKGGARLLGNAATKGFGNFMLKSLGATLGSMVAGAEITNTIQIGKTGANILESMNGDVYKDDKGNYVYGHYETDENGETKFVEGGNSFLNALAEAERSGISENGSEVLGTFLPGGSRLFEMLGLSKISKAITALQGKGWYQGYSKFLKTAGFNGIPGEGLEEYGGMVLDAMMGGEEWKNVADLRTHIDIWLGVTTMGGVLNAPNVIGTGYSAYQYQKYKKKVNIADINASSAIDPQVWQSLRETIDQTDNSQMADVAYGIMTDKNLSEEGKQAAMKYIGNLQKMRGYSLGSIAVEREQGTATANELNQSYTGGYNTQEPDLMKQYNDEAQKSANNLPGYGQEFAKMVTESQAPVETLDYLMQNRDYFTDEQIAAAADYYQKRSRAQGMMDGTLDRIDLEIEKQKARVREETHQATGDIIDAVGADGQPYNIIGGDVVTDPDTGVTSLVGTGGAVVVRNDNTGEVSVKSPQELNISNVVPAEAMIQYYDVDLRNQLMQQADEDITYGSPANETYQLEDTVALNDGNGNIIEGEIGMMPNSVDGVYVIYTPDGKALQFTADQMNRMIVAHNGQEVQRGSQQTMAQPTEQMMQNQAENAEIEGNYAQNQPQNMQSGTLDNATGENAAAEDAGQKSNQPQSALSRIPVLQDEKGQPILNKKGKPQYQWHKASVEDAAAALVETTGGNMVMARDTASDLVNQTKEKLEKIRKQKPKGEDPIEIAESRMAIQKQIDDTQAIVKQWQDVGNHIRKQMEAESERLRQEAEAKKSEEQRKREAAEAEERKKKQDEIDRQRIREQIEKDKEKRNKEYAPLTKAKEEMKDDPDAMAILSDTEPRSLDEWVSSLLRPHSMLWQDASPSEVGLQSELGLKRSDMQRFMTLLGNKDSNATPFGKAVLDIYEALPEGMKEMYTDEDVRNTLLNLFNEGSSTRMMHLTEENRIDEARQTMLENLRRDAEAEMEAWAEANHLTPEERETYEDFLAQEMMQGAETEFINQLIEQDEQDTESKAMDSNPASRTAGREGEGGESQVQGQGASETIRAYQEKRQPEQGEKAPAGSTNVSDSDVSGGAQGIEDETFIRDLNALLNDYDTGENGYLTDNDLIERARELAEELPSKSDLSKKINEALDEYDEMQQAYRFENGMRDDDGSEAMIETLREIAATKPKAENNTDPVSGKEFKYGNEYGECKNPNKIEYEKGDYKYTIYTAYHNGMWLGAMQTTNRPRYSDGGIIHDNQTDGFKTEAEAQSYYAQLIHDRFLEREDVKKIQPILKSLQPIIDKAPAKSEYESFEDLVADTNITVTDPATKKALRKIVDKIFLHGSSNTRKDPLKFDYKFVYMASGTNKADRALLEPWASSTLVDYDDNNPTATWVDEDEKRIYFIKYNPPGTAYSWDFVVVGYKSLPTTKQESLTEETTEKQIKRTSAPETDILVKGGTRLYTKDSIIKVIGSNINHDTETRSYKCALYDSDESYKNDERITTFKIEQQDMRQNLESGKYSSSDIRQKKEKTEKKSEKKEEKQPQLPETKRLVSDDRMEELKKKLRNKLGGQATMGLDLEIVSYGVQLSIGYLERGITKLADFTKKMIQEFGEAIRPYIDNIFNKAKEQTTPKTAWWNVPNRPKSIDRWDYRTYMTDEAKEYFANFKSEDGRTDFTKWAHPNLAYITAAVWDEVEIPYEDLKNVSEIAEAEKTIKNAEANGKLEISEEEANKLAQRLIDSGEARKEQKAFVIIGLPAGGKSSVFANPLSKQYGARIIDSDDVKPWLEGFDGGNGAGYVQDASAEVAEKAIDIAVKNGDNIIIPRIGGKSVMDLSAALRLAGYDVQLYFNDVKGVTSIDRAASRFAQTGRYLSLDYLTKKAGVPSENFSKFAEKTIGGYLDERNQEEVQDIRRRVQGLRGELYGSGSGLREPLAAEREGTGEAEGTVQAALGGRELQTGGNGVSILLEEPLFNYSEWKSNDVPFGQKPKEIWNSESGKPMPVKEEKNNGNLQSEQGLSRELGAAGEGTGQTSESADRAGAERGPEQNRAERSGHKHSVNHKRIVSDSRMEELKKRLKAKLFGQLNVGVDPEILAIGAEMAVGYLERGVTKFADFAKTMIEEVGDFMRPYLKSFYNAVRDMPEAQEYAGEMDDYQTVSSFDVNNFDKQGKVPDAITKAQQIVDEQKVRKDVADITDGLDMKETTINDIKDETDEQTAADTAAIVSEAEAIESQARSAKSREGRTATIEKIDKQLEKIDNQLAFIGFYDVDPDAPYHESMGSMKSAEKKAVADATKVARQIVKDLGIDAKPTAKANMAPIGGDITFRIPINENTDLYFDLLMERGYDSYPDSLEMDVSYFRLENKNNKPQDNGRYKNYTNHHFGVLTSYNELLDEVRQTIKQAGIELAEPKPAKQEQKKISKKSKQQAQNEQPSLFDMMFFDEEQPANTLGATSTPEKIEEEEAKVDTNPTEAQKEAGNYQKGHIQIDGYDITIENPKGSIRRGVDANGKTWEQVMNNTYGYIRGTEATDGDHIDVFLSENPTEGKVFVVDQVKPDGSFDEVKVLYGFKDIAVATKSYLSNYSNGWKGLGNITGVSREAFKEWVESSHRKTKPFREYALAKRELAKDNTIANIDDVFTDNLYVDSHGNEGAINKIVDIEEDGDTRWYVYQLFQNDEDFKKGKVFTYAKIHERDLQAALDTKEWRRKKENARPQRQLPKHNNLRNNVGERGQDYAPTSPKARFNANVEAIKLMRQLIDNAVEAPTKEQMEVLRKYSGWGGMGTFFNDDSMAENKQLRELLSEEEYNDAVMSINSAYYTPASVIDTLWDVANAMGFKGGNVLEGSAGIGNIIGQMPQDMSRRSNIEAVEIDTISGNILRLLYPDATVHIDGFQDVKIPNGTVDLAITNVPFVTGLHVIDKVDKDLSRKFTNIHDFCIAKNIRKLREGGIGIFITSAGTMDKSTKLRQWIPDEGQSDVVGAFRLNNETFGGTNVTSDIIVVRKRVGGNKSENVIDISKASPLRIGSYEDKYGEEKQVSMVINDYFKDHPEMMAGEMFFGYEKGDTFRPGSYGLYPAEGKNQKKMMQDFVKQMKKVGLTAEMPEIMEHTAPKAEPNQLTAVKEGRMLVDDNGRLCVSRYGTAWPLGLNDQKVKGHTKQECFNDYQDVQKAVDDVLQQQLNDPDDSALKPKLDELNKAYDKFTKRYGTLHKNTAISFLRNDVDFPSFQALENYSETKDIKGKVKIETKKAPLFTQRVLGFKTEPQPENIKDAVIASIFRTNTIDMDWIAEKLGKSVVDVKKEILESRLGFEDPSTGQMEIRYKYLSGNVREKLAIAEGYNTDGKYAANVEELRKAVPMDIPSHLIEFSLGSSWIPIELYKDYIKESLGLSNIKLTHVEGAWVFDAGYNFNNEKNRSAGVYSDKFRETIYGHQLVAAALNNRPVKVMKQVTVGYGDSKHTETRVDQAATSACAVRVDEIKDEFKQWAKKKMQDNPELAQQIEKIYNEKFNALVPMQIDNEFLPERFDGSNVIIELRPYQKRGAMRGLTSPTMLAHEVGTGKTFTLITTAMEMRRLGTAKKPMIVVQNSTVPQITADAKLLYPNAKVLSLTEKDRNAEGRRAFYASIKYNDWDMIIIPQSTLNMIPDSPERELQFIQEKIDEKKHVIEAAEAAGADSRQLQQMKKELDKLEQEYGDTSLDHDPANNTKKKKKNAKDEAKSLDKAETKAKEMLDRNVDDVQYFDDLGVDALLVDEAHEYKHLGFQTSIGRGIKGIDPSYSKKCAGLYNKTRAVFEKAGWKNVVFATGTPISNTAAEIWTFMKYLMQPDVMRANDIYYFDDFVHNFGNISQMLEFATSGKFKENTRFASYVNKPELIRIWTQVADIVLTSNNEELLAKIPKKEGGKDQDVFLPQSPSLVRIMTAVRAELERFENMSGKEKKENSSIPLTMFGIAKRAAIDPRLVNPDAPDEPMSKTNAAVKEILKDLKATQSYKGTVAVFCDNQNRLGKTADGKNYVEWNIYEEMRNKLIEAGVPAEQIAIIKSGMSMTAKQKVFDAVNAGDIRVVFGSTQTLGTGVNMQERLHMLIHMDAPDRPMDYTQRNGRIERQGNLHKEWGKTIRILRFGVEDSLDVTAYQRLKTKSGFIDSIMKGEESLQNNQVDRTIEEEEEGLFDNPVAVLSGSQYALKKNQAERDLRKYQGKKTQWENDQVYVTHALRRNKSEIEDSRKLIAEYKAELEHYKKMFPDGKVKVVTIEGEPIDLSKGDADAYVKMIKTFKEKIQDPVNATVKKLRENPIYNDETLNYTVELDGHPINFRIDVFRTSEYENGKMKTVLHKATHYKSADLRLTSDVTDRSKSARECVEDIMQEYISGNYFNERIDTFNNKINRLNAESEQLHKRVGMEFQFSKELEEAKKHVEEYTELMKKEMEEKEAKYAAQQKEVQENGGGFDLSKAEDTDDDGNLYRIDDDMPWEDDEDNPIFYSNAMQAVDSIRQDKAAPQQWLAMIVKNGGLKAGEDRWLGLSDWLNNSDKKSITKQELKNFIRMNQIYVEETHYTDGNEILREIEKKYPGYENAFIIEEDDFTETPNYSVNDLKTAVDLYNKHHTIKIAIDNEGNITDDQYDDVISFASEVFDKVAIAYPGNTINPTRFQYTTFGLDNYREIALTVPTVEPWGQGDTLHFGDAGGGRAVAWVRFGETTDSEGKRVLVIDEIQSKRHQEGRKLGYKNDSLIGKADEALKELVAFRRSLYDKYPGLSDIAYLKDYATPEEIAKERELDKKHKDLERQERNQKMAPPDAPFEKNWQELAMKRMLRYAAENGYDKIAWTTGRQQAERYNIGKLISLIDVSKWGQDVNGYAIDSETPNDERGIYLHVKNKENVALEVNRDGIITYDGGEGYKGHTLAELVGKELAQQILKSEGKNRINNGDFRVDYEGMKGFYDDMLPRFMNKYGKKWGVSVSMVELPKLTGTPRNMWSVDVTPQMKESVMLGQPMFRDMEQFIEGETFPIYRGEYHSNYNVLGNRSTYSTDLMPDEYQSEYSMLDALRNQYPEYYVTIEDGRVKMQTFESVMADAMLTQTAKKAKGTESYVERKTKRAIDAVESMAKRMNLDVEVLTSTDGLTEKQQRAKGWFNKNSHKIYIVLPNHRTQSDVINTLLHEGVAHYGLRKMFGEYFDTFLDNVYNNVDPKIREAIDASIKVKGWSRHEATEEYLARLAERTEFKNAQDSGWWRKIKDFFISMLAKAGFNTILTDNELRYILWRSYDNLLHPNDRRNIFDTARDIDMQSRLKVGPYEERTTLRPTAAAEPMVTREPEVEVDETTQIINEAKANDTYMKAPNGNTTNLTEDQWVQVRTKAFKNWFGDWQNDPENASKVVDENGEPAVMYHGTNLDAANNGEPFYTFYPSSHFGTKGQAEDRADGRAKIYQVFLNIRNPQRRNDANQEYLEDHDMTMSEFWEQSVERAKGKGHDGVVYLNRYEDPENPADSWIAFEPNQIKSATDNNGEYSPENDDIRYRSDDDWDDVAKQMYEKVVANSSTKWTENWQDSMVSLKAIQDAIAAETGNEATGAEDAYHFENRMHGRAKNMTEQYDWRYYRPMLKAFNEFCKQNDMTQQQGIEYLVAKSGLERNVYYAFRDAAKAKLTDEINEEREDLEKMYAKGRINEEGYKAKKQELEERERDGVDDFMKSVRETFAYQHAKDEYENGNISYTEYMRIIERVIRAEVQRKNPRRDADGNVVSDNYYDDYAKDYSGLTETFAKDMYDAAQNVKKQAQKAIDPQERKELWRAYDEQMRNAYYVAKQVADDQVFAAENNSESREKADKLWNKINAATKETLKHSYESGLIDRNNYNKVRAMFDYYIPLRGWEEDKAADVYTYMGRDNVFSPAVKKVWGRTSQAENPLAYIGNIAVSTILSGHRNQMKQHFLNYVMNNPTSLVNISESWYENIGSEDDKPVWILRTADTAGKSADEIAQIVNDFNEEMRLKQEEGKAMPVKGRLRLDLHATSGQKAEHVVEVQRAGHTYQLYINGDPKAAQALNGTAAKAVSRISDTWLGNKITNVNRNMAAFFTSKNPAFVVSNLSRDLNMAGASVAIKENAAYNAKFIENVVKVLRPRISRGSKYGLSRLVAGPRANGFTGLMPSLMRKWMAGDLNLNDDTERVFGEFMDEGGETGFVNMLSVDSFKQKMQKEIREMNGSTIFGSKANVKETTIGKGLRLLGETFEFYNRCAEDATRFIVYMTSRQMGKSLEDSIADAKDVTLNFNRKGTGGMGNAEVRDLFIFVDPAIQALANMYKMATGNTLKFGTVTAAFIAGGALMAVMNQWMLNLFGDDDDKDAYWNLPPWVRKNNLVFWIPGTKNFVTIPLAQEFRVFYGVGEMVTSTLMEHPVDRWGLEVFSSVADLVPINPTGNGGNLMVDFAPTMVQPLMQVGENIDFTGKPIWKENQGNKFAPMYTKAYITTPTWMVNISEGINNLTGGNEGKKGVIEEYSPFWADYVNNPAVWNHLLQGYFGGMYNTIAKTFDVGVTVATGNVPKIYQTPVINRFLNRPVERDNAGVLGDDYYRLTEDRDALQYELRTWQKKAADGEEGAQEHVDEILQSEDWKRAEVITHYEKIIKDLKAGEKASNQDIDKQEIKESIALYKQEMIEELAAIDEGTDPLTVARKKFDEAKTFAEKNKLRMRIERLQGNAGRDQKSSEDAVRKALAYREDEERESRDTNDAYLMIATAENIADDARIKTAKAEIAKYMKEYKQMMADGRTERANSYRKRNQKYFTANDIIQQQSRSMATNKKLLGKGHDAAIMKLIDQNRKQMLKVIDGLE